MRLLIRLVVHLGVALSRRGPWAMWVLVAAAGFALIAAFLAWVRRPLGGDPAKTPLDDDKLRDDKNPYRQQDF